MAWCRIVKSEIESGGKSLFPPYAPLGNVWELTGECGRSFTRPVRYTPPNPDTQLMHGRGKVGNGPRGGWRYRRRQEDALPAPKKVRCPKNCPLLEECKGS